MRIEPGPRLSAPVLASLVILGVGLALVVAFAFVAVDLAPPTKVGGMQMEDELGGRIRLTWDAALDNVGVHLYRVYRNGLPVAAVYAPSTSYLEPGIPVEVPMEYRVAAVDRAGNEGPLSDSLVAVSAPEAPDVAFAPWESTPSDHVAEIASASSLVNLSRFQVTLLANLTGVVVAPRSPLDLPVTRDNVTLDFVDAYPDGRLGAGDAFLLRNPRPGVSYTLRLLYVPTSALLAASDTATF